MYPVLLRFVIYFYRHFLSMSAVVCGWMQRKSARREYTAGRSHTTNLALQQRRSAVQECRTLQKTEKSNKGSVSMQNYAQARPADPRRGASVRRRTQLKFRNAYWAKRSLRQRGEDSLNASLPMLCRHTQDTHFSSQVFGSAQAMVYVA